jgi:superfamily II DNA or RNA helicase
LPSFANSDPTSPEARAALAVVLASPRFDRATRQRGLPYAFDSSITNLRTVGSSLVATVSGAESYDTRLNWDGGTWRFNCSCPIITNCKHAYAVGYHWCNRLGPKTAEFPFAKTFRPQEPSAADLRRTLLDNWSRRFETLARASGAAPAEAAQVRLVVLSAKKCYWEKNHSPAPTSTGWVRWSADDIRHDLLDTFRPTFAAALDATSLALLTLWRPHLTYHGRVLPRLDDGADRAHLALVLRHSLASKAVVHERGAPFTAAVNRVVWQIRPDPEKADQIRLALGLDNNTPLPPDLRYLGESGGEAFYLGATELYRGLPPPAPDKAMAGEALIPAELLDLPSVQAVARQHGIALPALPGRPHLTIEPLTPVLYLSVVLPLGASDEGVTLRAELFANAPDGTVRQRLDAAGWATVSTPPVDRFADVHSLAPCAEHFRTGSWQHPHYGEPNWTIHTTLATLEPTLVNVRQWLTRIPPGTRVETTSELAELLTGGAKARWQADLEPDQASGIDWFDLTVKCTASDATLTPAEVKLLLAARGRWVRLPSGKLRRLSVELDDALATQLSSLGLNPDSLGADSATEALTEARVRLHTLQLAQSELDDRLAEAARNRLRARVRGLAELPPAKLPTSLRAELRPYQREGFAWLARLSDLGLGGLLCDDMGLGKTLQALAWLLWLHERAPAARPLRVLIVCPKSVAPNWARETTRFAPSLHAFVVERGASVPDVGPAVADAPHLVVVNYTQLRLRAEALQAVAWDVVVLDEAQAIKNPSSQTARLARQLRANHRLVLTGTPVENRLLDLWSLFAFAFPGLLGTQADFNRLYSESGDKDNDARARLAARVRPFLLRRTKSQVAADLPPRIEEDLAVALEPAQRRLYDAELKRARAALLGVETDRALDAVRFNVLQSLLRLRQICCDPRLLDSSAKSTDSAKLEALLDLVEPLVAEGHRVLVFSQFVGVLELLERALIEKNIRHLMLTGASEDRQALVDRFQSPDGPPVFLLSLKAAGSGLNLTAASYVVLYDPWWNPAVEAQAIDRTHRIGQTSKVIAYRLLAQGTIEEKIRALQRDKAAVAASILGDESGGGAPPLDLATLRELLSA